MATINTNMSANVAANSLSRNDRSMAATMERLSTGIRINSAKDDAAGLAITSKMTSQINGLNQAVRNANDAISMIQVGEGALKEVTNMLQRMRELAIQASSDSNTTADRTALNNEFTQLRDEITRINANTEWNGTAIFAQGATAESSKVFQVGANASQTISVVFKNFDAGITAANVSSGARDADDGSAFFTLDTDGDTSTVTKAQTPSQAENIETLAITSRDGSNSAMFAMSAAIDAVNSQRALLGASMSRLEFASDNLQNVAQNSAAARSRVLDADYAAETTELARTQIIQQAGTAMLSQANQSQQNILALLQS